MTPGWVSGLADVLHAMVARPDMQRENEVRMLLGPRCRRYPQSAGGKVFPLFTNECGLVPGSQHDQAGSRRKFVPENSMEGSRLTP
jgi:hypothetical protein